MKRSKVKVTRFAAIVVLLVGASVSAQDLSAPPVPSISLVRPEAPTGPPMVVTLAARCSGRSRTGSVLAALRTAVATGDRVRRASLPPSFSNSTQFLGNSASPGLAADGSCRWTASDVPQWLVARPDSPNTFTGAPLLKARAAEAAAQARLEIAQRGLVVTVTRIYHAFISAQRKYATAQQGAQQAQRFFEIAQQQERLGQVARSDVVKAEILSRQQHQAFDEATLAMDNARLSLAVLIFPVFNENFSVVDDMQAAPALPPFTDIRMMAERENPDLRAASELLRAAGEDVRLAKSSFYPNVFVEAVYGIEANAFALHSEPAADRALGVPAQPRLCDHRKPDGVAVGLGLAAEQAASKPGAAAPVLDDAEPDTTSAGQQPLLDVQRGADGPRGCRQPSPRRRTGRREPPADDTAVSGR